VSECFIGYVVDFLKELSVSHSYFLCACKHLISRFECLDSKFRMFGYFIGYVVDYQKLLSVLQQKKHSLESFSFPFGKLASLESFVASKPETQFSLSFLHKTEKLGRAGKSADKDIWRTKKNQ